MDDHDESRAVLVRMLSDAGLHVRAAAEGAAAVELCRDWRPHLVFMDLMMPVMDGISAAKHIRLLPEFRETKIVAMTASAFASERERVLASGMNDFMRKPYRPEEVFDCLTSHLSIRFRSTATYDNTQTHGDQKAPDEPLDGVPATLLQELEDAVVSLNRQHISSAIEKIADFDTALAEMIRGMHHQFRYTAMLKLIQRIRRESASRIAGELV